MNYNLNVISENNVDRYLLCDNKENYYSINKSLFDILLEYKNTNVSREICENLNRKRGDNFFSLNYIEQSLEKVKSIIYNDISLPQNQKYIKYKVTLVKEGALKKTYSFFALSFTKYLFPFVSLLSIFISIAFIYKSGYTNLNLLYNKIIVSATTVNLIIAFILSQVIVLIHEMGHAAAAFKYNIKPKEIGAGLYFIFPVFYTNVTNIWNLPRAKRMVVNLGGIYFQLIINSFLILFYCLGFFTQIISLLFIFNTISILISFNPFFRYDGYWLFSDFFNIYNLKKKSKDFVTNAISFPNKIKSYINLHNISSSIIVYSILNVAFWIKIYFSIIQYLIKNIPTLISLVFVKNEFTVRSIGTMFTCFIIIFWIIVTIKTIYINLLKNNSHAKQ